MNTRLNKSAGRLKKRGIAVVYVLLLMSVMIGMVSLGAEYARVQLVKTELQRAADAAARFAATAIPNGETTVRASAKASALENKADGTDIVLLDEDVQMGKWNTSTKTFTVLTGNNVSNANAVRVYARRIASRGTAVPLVFTKLLGRSNCDASCSSIAVLTGDSEDVRDIPSTSNPWMAGMPNGTIANANNPANNSDTAPAANPQKITGIPINPGDALTFDSIDGGANNFSSNTLYTPDGNTDWVINNWGGSEHGKSDIYSPINAVVAVFLTDAKPSTMGAAPAVLDFSTEEARNFTTLKPLLRQVFFIGDGRRTDGSIQRFVVPAGATRLYIGTMDGWEWNNNIGKYTTTIHKVGTVTTVR